MWTVRLITPEDTRSLRHRVLWPHLSSPEACVLAEDHRPDAIHVGVWDGDWLIATGSFFALSSSRLPPGMHYRLRAMATDPDYRGSGAGKMLVEEGIRLLRQLGAEVLWCDARLAATGFYAGLGFQLQEEIYEVPLIGPHQFMWLDLATD